MTLFQYQSFAINYPLLRNFIVDCWKAGKDEEFLNFLFALETKEIRA